MKNVISRSAGQDEDSHRGHSAQGSRVSLTKRGSSARPQPVRVNRGRLEMDPDPANRGS